MGKKLNLLNEQFNKLLVIEEAPSKNGRSRWKCKCECGNEIIVDTADLRRGHTQSCGCLQRERTSQSTLKDITGQWYGELEVLERDMNYQGKGVSSHWFCKCHQCGQIKSISLNSLRAGAISCGCAKSKGEYKIMKILQHYNINFIPQFSFEQHKNRRYDFALLNKQGKVVRLIEFDGLQHYYRPRAEHWSSSLSLEDTQARDLEKNQIALNNGVELIRIPYWHLEKLTIIDLLNDRFLIKEE